MADDLTADAVTAWEGQRPFGELAADATIGLKTSDSGPDGKVAALLTLEGGTCTSAELGTARGAKVTLTASHDLMAALMTGNADPAEQYMTGDLKVEGDMTLWLNLARTWHDAYRSAAT